MTATIFVLGLIVAIVGLVGALGNETVSEEFGEKLFIGGGFAALISGTIWWLA